MKNQKACGQITSVYMFNHYEHPQYYMLTHSYLFYEMKHSILNWLESLLLAYFIFVCFLNNYAMSATIPICSAHSLWSLPIPRSRISPPTTPRSVYPPVHVACFPTSAVDPSDVRTIPETTRYLASFSASCFLPLFLLPTPPSSFRHPSIYFLLVSYKLYKRIPSKWRRPGCTARLVDAPYFAML